MIESPLPVAAIPVPATPKPATLGPIQNWLDEIQFEDPEQATEESVDVQPAAGLVDQEPAVEPVDLELIASRRWRMPRPELSNWLGRPG